MEFLASSAKELGDYVVDKEYELILEEFLIDRPVGFTEFMRWVRSYMYYHAVYCVCAGVPKDVVEYMQKAYIDLIQDANDEDERMEANRQSIERTLDEEDEINGMEDNIVEIEDPIEQWGN